MYDCFCTKSTFCHRNICCGIMRKISKLYFSPPVFAASTHLPTNPFLPDSGVLEVGPCGVTHGNRLYFFSRMGSSRLLYRAEWSGRYASQISPSSPCHLLPPIEAYVSELQLIHLSCALISTAAAKEVFSLLSSLRI